MLARANTIFACRDLQTNQARKAEQPGREKRDLEATRTEDPQGGDVSGKREVLLYDIGDGTFYVSLMIVEKERPEIEPMVSQYKNPSNCLGGMPPQTCPPQARQLAVV